MLGTKINPKRVLISISLGLFIIGIFLWMALPILGFKIKQELALISATTKEKLLTDSRTSPQYCPASQDQIQNNDNDVLFIGCNGFY
jgi:hypothetical protein